MASREEWIGQTGKEWARRGDALDVLLGPAGQSGLDALAPQPGMRVLDLGCGGGASTAALSDRVGARGHVTGVDISPDLIARAKARLEGRANATLIEADAQTYPFEEGGHDALYSRFGAMFFDDPPRAFANLHRALTPRAPVALVAWRDIRRNHWASVPMTFVAEEVPGTPPSGAPGPGPFAWADPETFRPLLEGAGFRRVEATPYDFMAEISDGDDPDPLERVVAFMMRVGPLAARLRSASDAARQEAGRFLTRRLARYVQDNSVRLPASAWVIRAEA